MIAINDLTRVIHAAERMDLWLYARGVHRLAAFKEECLQKDTYRCKFDYEMIQWEAFYSWIMINITHLYWSVNKLGNFAGIESHMWPIKEGAFGPNWASLKNTS